MKAFRPVHLLFRVEVVPFEADARSAKAAVELTPNSANTAPNRPFLAGGSFVLHTGERLLCAHITHDQDIIETESHNQAGVSVAISGGMHHAAGGDFVK